MLARIHWPCLCLVAFPAVVVTSLACALVQGSDKPSSRPQSRPQPKTQPQPFRTEGTFTRQGIIYRERTGGDPVYVLVSRLPAQSPGMAPGIAPGQVEYHLAFATRQLEQKAAQSTGKQVTASGAAGWRGRLRYLVVRSLRVLEEEEQP
jgi:hypothetical protein